MSMKKLEEEGEFVLIYARQVHIAKTRGLIIVL